MLLRCSTCRADKPDEAFGKDRAKTIRRGRSYTCRDCFRAYHARWCAANPERTGEYRRRHRASLPADELARRDREKSVRQAARVQADPVRREARNAKGRAYRAAKGADYRKAESRRRYENNREAYWEMATQRRALKQRAQTDGPVNRRLVFERDGYLCWICGEPTKSDGTPRERSSIDHIIPLSEGGAHSMDNVRCAHQGCNARRYQFEKNAAKAGGELSLYPVAIPDLPRSATRPGT